jgi:hypothetical protein
MKASPVCSHCYELDPRQVVDYRDKTEPVAKSRPYHVEVKAVRPTQRAPFVLALVSVV